MLPRGARMHGRLVPTEQAQFTTILGPHQLVAGLLPNARLRHRHMEGFGREPYPDRWNAEYLYGFYFNGTSRRTSTSLRIAYQKRVNVAMLPHRAYVVRLPQR